MRCARLTGEFVEVYVHATVDEIAAHRDPKGLYKKALAGEIAGFTGVDPGAPYEAPEHPEIYVDTETQTPEESLQFVLTRLKELGSDRRRHRDGDRRPCPLGHDRPPGRRGGDGRQGALTGRDCRRTVRKGRLGRPFCLSVHRAFICSARCRLGTKRRDCG